MGANRLIVEDRTAPSARDVIVANLRRMHASIWTASVHRDDHDRRDAAFRAWLDGPGREAVEAHLAVGTVWDSSEECWRRVRDDGTLEPLGQISVACVTRSGNRVLVKRCRACGTTEWTPVASADAGEPTVAESARCTDLAELFAREHGTCGEAR